MRVPIKVKEGHLGEPFSYHSKTASEVLQVLNTQSEGLSASTAKERQRKYGYNRFTEVPPVSIWRRIYDQLSSPLAFVLVVASVATLVLQEYIDAGVIFFALFIAVSVGVLQEGRAGKAFKTLSDSQVKKTTVVREGERHQIPAEQLVPGDIVVLESGDLVPADLRLIKTKKLSTNEASLTGEWALVEKGTEPVTTGAGLAEQSSMAWMGTSVANGHGMGVVVAIGDRTQIGQVAESVRDVEEVDTPLQHEVKELSRLLLFVIGGLVAAVFIIGLVQGQSLHDMLLMSIAMAVASVPEGLPAAVTIILAIGMEALLRRGGLVRNLLAAETLGSTTYVLTDKTGTLTEAKMSVAGLLVEDGVYVDMEDVEEYEPVRDMFRKALAASNAYREATKKGSVLRGDPVEQAILETAEDLGVLDQREARLDYLSFTSENRLAAGLLQGDQERFLAVNGAPETLLDKATKVATRDGEIALTAELKTEIKEAILTQTTAGKRLVAVGYKSVCYEEIPDYNEELVNDLVFCGVLILADPVREGVSESIAGVKAAGAQVILVTGDNPETALSVAQKVGIAKLHDVVLTGSDISDLSDEELLVALREIKVFARVLPKQKMRIASVLQKTGEVVAMTGDGVNDAPALQRANIGVAIGSGTEVAKEASDLVLLKDSFSTIYAAIEEGRRIVDNLRKIVGYLLSTSLSEVVLIGAALTTGGAAPILPAQILWANIIEEGLMSVAFAFEKGEKNSMKRRPQDIHEEGLLSRDMLRFVAFIVSVFSLLTVSLYFYLRSLDLPLEDLRSLIFLAVAMDSLFISFSFRSLTVPLWNIPLRTNFFFIVAFLVNVLLFAVVLTIPFFQLLLSFKPQPWDLMLLPIATSVATVVCIEVGKWLFLKPRT